MWLCWAPKFGISYKTTMKGMTWPAPPSRGWPEEDLLSGSPSGYWQDPISSELLAGSHPVSCRGTANKELGLSNMVSCAIKARKRFCQPNGVPVSG